MRWPNMIPDHSAILYLSLVRPDHTNVYRVSVSLQSPICPETLQRAADRIHSRFPSIIAGFHPGVFHYSVIPAKAAPTVMEDPGPLTTMSRHEIETCAYRILYSENTISIEVFHALTDGYGAFTSFRTLLAEYLFLLNGIETPERKFFMEDQPLPLSEELEDVYPMFCNGVPSKLPSRYAYQLPRLNHDGVTDHDITVSRRYYSTEQVLTAAQSHGVSLTALLSCIMAESIMEIQQKQSTLPQQPVSIMVPVDLRRHYPSRTLRNFILYALPSLFPGDMSLSPEDRLCNIHRQLKDQTSKEALSSRVTYNVQAQSSRFFRIIPRVLKCFSMRLAYRFFGESNSSITMTNMGMVPFSDELLQHLDHLCFMLTPRRQSPYNCAICSMGSSTCITLTRFGSSLGLEASFFRKLDEYL